MDTQAEDDRVEIRSKGSEENNNSRSHSVDFGPDEKDEYLDDPLPDLVGSLRISEEPEPDITISSFGLESEEFLLEDFEFNANSEEEDEVYSSSDSDLEFFDARNIHERLESKASCLVSDLPENENVLVEFEHGGSGNGGSNARVNVNEGISEGGASGSGSLTKMREKAKKVAKSVKGIVGKRRNNLGKDIRVFYQNLDKPYTAKVSGNQHFKKFLTLGQETNSIGASMSQSSSINDLGSPIDVGMTPEELEAARQEWQSELNLIEDEIQTLRQVLTAKSRRAHELKRKLGVTAWGEFTQDMGQGLKNVRESNAVQKMEETFTGLQSAVVTAPIYQKTESAIKATAEKTTSLLGGIGSAMSQKLGALKNTDSFRSMEERVSSAVSTVKTKMGGSRSGSVQSFDDALREATANQGTNPDGTRPNGTPNAVPNAEEKQQAP